MWKRSIWPGIALLLLGVLMLLGQLGIRLDGLFAIAIGGFLLYLWYAQHRSWTLIVGSLIASSGLASLLSPVFYAIAPHMPVDSLFLGFGFLAIYAQARGAHRWSLWPGGIIIVLTLMQWISRFNLFSGNQTIFWAVVLLIAGAAILVTSLLRRRDEDPPPPQQ